MVLSVIGINHHSASLALREQVAYDESKISLALQEMQGTYGIAEAVIVSTCNRTEVYTSQTYLETLLTWWRKRHGFNDQIFADRCYRYQGALALEHLLRVSVGLDSAIVGEPQILGQIKKAYQLAEQLGTVGSGFKQIFPAVFAAAKNVRHETAIGEHALSLAYAIVQLARRIFADLSECRVLLVGSGEMIASVAQHFYGQNMRGLHFASRNLSKLTDLSERFAAKMLPLTHIPQLLSDIDIVVTATQSQLPILGKGMFETALKQKRHRPMLIADLALPRDVEPEVSSLEDIYLYNLDDLQTVLAQNFQSRQEAAQHAEMLIQHEVNHCLSQLRIREAGDIIRDFRHAAERMREEELLKAQQELRQGRDAAAVVANLAHQLTNKILHQPTVQLRQAAYENRQDLLLLAKQLFSSKTESS